MRILYVHREFSSVLNGGTYVMHRNYEMLTRLFGGDNVICYSVARPTLKIIVLSLLRMGCYGVSKRDEERILLISFSLKGHYLVGLLNCCMD